MFSNIKPEYYFLDSIYQKEKESIFYNNWIFIGFKSDLKNNNDFITKKVCDIPIVVQNFNGMIRAFINVCSHRFSLLQTQDKGNRALFCPYHGWSFDKNGIPAGIPKKPLFKDFSQKELCDLKLKEFSVDYCGNLVFVHINEPKQTLKEYLGSFYNDIEKISTNENELIDTNKIQIKSNWKVIVENTLESYHVNLVHGETFKKLGAKGLKFNFCNNHSNWEAELNLSENDPKLSKIHKNFSNRSFVIDGYIHYLIFPNLLVSSTYGISYNYSTIFPIDSDTTEFTSYVLLSQCQDNPIVSAYKKSLIDFNRKVFDEDKIICEYVQEGVKVTDKIGVLSLEEERVHSFQNHYINEIK